MSKFVSGLTDGMKEGEGGVMRQLMTVISPFLAVRVSLGGTS